MKNLWEVAIVAVCAFLGVGGGFTFAGKVKSDVAAHGKRITALEQEDVVTVVACGQKMKTCQLHINSELGHGTEQFATLNNKFDDLDSKFDEANKETAQWRTDLMKFMIEQAGKREAAGAKINTEN